MWRGHRKRKSPNGKEQEAPNQREKVKPQKHLELWFIPILQDVLLRRQKWLMVLMDSSCVPSVASEQARWPLYGLSRERLFQGWGGDAVGTCSEQWPRTSEAAKCAHKSIHLATYRNFFSVKPPKTVLPFLLPVKELLIYFSLHNDVICTFLRFCPVIFYTFLRFSLVQIYTFLRFSPSFSAKMSIFSL